MRRKPWGVVGGHHAVELPVRGAAVDARAEPARRATRAVFKPSRGHAGGRPAARRAVRRGRLPARASSTSSTATARSARRWCANPGVNVVCFTGSYDVGRRIQEVSAELPDRIVAAEMGGKSAVIVCDDARLDLAVTAGILSARSRRAASAACRRAASSSTSRCSTAFARAVRRRRRSGCSSATRSTPSNFAGPVIHAAAVEKVERYNALAQQEGADGAARRRPAAAGEPRRGCFLSPFVYRIEHEPGAARASARRCSARTSRSIPFRDERGRGADLQRHASTGCRWR